MVWPTFPEPNEQSRRFGISNFLNFWHVRGQKNLPHANRPFLDGLLISSIFTRLTHIHRVEKKTGLLWKRKHAQRLDKKVEPGELHHIILNIIARRHNYFYKRDKQSYRESRNCKDAPGRDLYYLFVYLLLTINNYATDLSLLQCGEDIYWYVCVCVDWGKKNSLKL